MRKIISFTMIWVAVALLSCCGSSGSTETLGVSSTSSAGAVSSINSSAELSSSSTSSISSSNSSSSQISGADSGLAARPSNTSCLAPAPVSAGALTINWPAAFTSLPLLTSPVGLFQLIGDSTNWYVMSQTGVINRFSNQAATKSLIQVLDIQDRVNDSANETGLLGVAVHPQFSNNRYVFLYYTGDNSKGALESRVARYKVNTDGSFDKASELILLRIDRPYSNHVGGQLAFGSDGYLYIASGDGGSGGDPEEYGQNTNVLLGKILRIDVDTVTKPLNYAIPSDNPFVGVANTRAEIWAYGLRNPWRFSFDMVTNKLWVADVGQNVWEEINLVTRGGNYGWGDMEGNGCYSERPKCSTANKIKPIHVINHNTGVCSVTGGYVYRGAAYPAVYGKYFFTDYCASTMQAITLGSKNEVSVTSHGSVPANIVSFAQDNQGELYALGQSNTAGQQIFKLQVGGGMQPGVPADHLSATGCVKSAAPREPSAGLIPYDVLNPLWSDGAEKQRYLALPNTTKIDVNSDGDFQLPVGSVLVKHFTLDEKFVETRLFMHGELGWQGFSYEWQDDQSDALLLPRGKDKIIGSVNWHYPSRDQCLVCHTRAANFSLGVEAQQLNRKFIYPSTGITANQLTTFEYIGLFNNSPTSEQKTAKLLSLDDTNASIEARARSYLHSNCSGCHRPNGPTASNLDLRFSTTFANTHACNQSPTSGDVGITNPVIVAPSEPDRSVLLARMKLRDTNQMPPIGTQLVDAAAVQVVTDWIAGLQNCN